MLFTGFLRLSKKSTRLNRYIIKFIICSYLSLRIQLSSSVLSLVILFIYNFMAHHKIINPKYQERGKSRDLKFEEFTVMVWTAPCHLGVQVCISKYWLVSIGLLWHHLLENLNFEMKLDYNLQIRLNSICLLASFAFGTESNGKHKIQLYGIEL